jgi:hypothetical protein
VQQTYKIGLYGKDEWKSSRQDMNNDEFGINAIRGGGGDG